MNYANIAYTIRKAADLCGIELRPYSGRGMYGTRCIGLDCDNPVSATIDLVDALINTVDASDLDECIDALRGAKTDSMGRGSIVYWPKLEWVESEDSDVDQDSEPSDD